MIKAFLYDRKEHNRIECKLCSHRCQINVGQTGFCRVRKNIEGKLYSLNSDLLAAVHLDPIEKKPLYHFLPGSNSFSIAAMGCNFSCHFCQNYSLSIIKDHDNIMGESYFPERIIDDALSLEAKSISYTYSEPTVFFEMMYEIAQLAKKRSIRNVMVSNGYMTLEAIELIAPFLDAINVDLKSFNDVFYKKYCGAQLQPVLETINELKRRNIWVEITTLLIPELNTDRHEQENLIQFLLKVDPSMPWHVSRFFPHHKMMNYPITASSVIHDSLKLAYQMGMKFVYSGNIDVSNFSNTICPNCHQNLINRRGYSIEIKMDIKGQCPNCGQKIEGVWE